MANELDILAKLEREKGEEKPFSLEYAGERARLGMKFDTSCAREKFLYGYDVARRDKRTRASARGDSLF